MARGSETISTKWVEGAKRECIRCGVKITNLDKQVGEVRSRYPGPVREITCRDCMAKRAEEMVVRTRQMLGLDSHAGGNREGEV